jgi:ATP-dependent Lon protease
LKDAAGQSRPFAFIAIGGSANGSTLEGHNYTYSNSTWGRIVDILMESKCMNPIIYIDELDKVSKTENGKEIIGILIHIIDSSQNTGFQDKYFSGIDIDLSQVLFVFSYNNPEDIDKILLDRIHRIPFDSLSLQDKVIISRQYILTTLEHKLGFTRETIQVDDKTIEHVIDTYTNESGIRKTKQLFFDIYSQINLDLLHCKITELPVVLSPELVDSRYLQKAPKNIIDRIHAQPEVGVMNALYATHNGNGGIIKIECMMIPAASMLDMKLTGSLGKVFTESMEICKNLAWSILQEDVKKAWLLRFESTKVQGLHVHFGDCNTPKEGASASLASALTIYSVFTNQRLRNDIAMTGETNLFGHAKRIGGIEAKFLGGIKAGVKVFFYPEENQEDVDRFFEKVGDKYSKTHQFYAIRDLRQVIHHPVAIFTRY